MSGPYRVETVKNQLRVAHGFRGDGRRGTGARRSRGCVAEGVWQRVFGRGCWVGRVETPHPVVAPAITEVAFAGNYAIKE